jgi:hypothetical protein
MQESAPKLDQRQERRQEIADAVSAQYDKLKQLADDARVTLGAEKYQGYMDELVMLYHSAHYTTQFITLQLKYRPDAGRGEGAIQIGPEPELKQLSIKLQHEYEYNVQTARESDIETNLQYAETFLERMQALPGQYGLTATT